jgi:hypothetical protein
MMRRTVVVFCYTIISIGTLLTIIDWLGRWDWIKDFLAANPKLEALVHTPLASILLVIFGFLALRAERQLDRPRIAAKFINSRLFPDLRTTTMQTLFDTENKTPGWDKTKINWEWFIEARLANDSNTPTTIERIETKVTINDDGQKETRRILNLSDDFDKYTMDMATDGFGNPHHHAYADPRYRPVPNLMDAIRKVPLTIGIGHRGWLRFKLEGVSQGAVRGNKVKIDIWLVDALDGKHKLDYKKGDDRNWDNSFLIIRDRD